MKKYVFGLLLAWLGLTACEGPQPQQWLTPYERDPERNTTATYQECMAYYGMLARHYPQVRVVDYGPSDAGVPLTAVIVSADGLSQPQQWARKRLGSARSVFMINNAIHPGEPEGVDATMMFVRDLVQQDSLRPLLDHVVFVIIPMYNLGGVLNRNSTTRANQNGPREHGFRGNSRNLDLNRDFIKLDSREARQFTRIFHDWQPDLLVDNHTTNGADYPYVQTLIPPHAQHLGGGYGQYVEDSLTQAFYRQMATAGFPMCPYVRIAGPTEKQAANLTALAARNSRTAGNDAELYSPDSGLVHDMTSGRYSDGYAALFHVPGYVCETHMLKEYAPRVQSTYQLMRVMATTLAAKGPRLRQLRTTQEQTYATQKAVPLVWKPDFTQPPDSFLFAGYQAEITTSEVTGQPRLRYHRSRTWQRNIPYYRRFTADLVAVPHAYVVPQAWHEVIDRLRANGVRLEPLNQDTTLQVQAYFLNDYTAAARPYEGHHAKAVTPTAAGARVNLLKGDYLIPTQGQGRALRYLIETLEPRGEDSFFAWGFFDSALQRKEYFSAYVFEDLAAELLSKDTTLAGAFQRKRTTEPDFAASGAAQLRWLYEHSPYAEPSAYRYPVFRLVE